MIGIGTDGTAWGLAPRIEFEMLYRQSPEASQRFADPAQVGRRPSEQGVQAEVFVGKWDGRLEIERQRLPGLEMWP